MAGGLASGFRVLIAPGLNDSGPEHWQTRWQALYPSFQRIRQDDWSRPSLPQWSARVGEALASSAQPTLIVAHSFGCLATVHRAAIGLPQLFGLLLVAPADPQGFGLESILEELVLPCPGILVASRNDPWMRAERALHWASRWGCKFVDAGRLGHINAESGLDDWLFGLSLLQRLALRTGTPAALKA